MDFVSALNARLDSEPPKALESLRDDPATAKKIATTLGHLGFLDFDPKYFTWGGTALVYYRYYADSSDSVVLRFSKVTDEPERAATPCVLQPFYSIICNGYRIECLPHVHMIKELLYDPAKHVPNHDMFPIIRGLVQDAAKQGYVFWDCRPANIGMRLLDGKYVPVIIDPGALYPLSKVDLDHLSPEAKDHISACAITCSRYTHSEEQVREMVDPVGFLRKLMAEPSTLGVDWNDPRLAAPTPTKHYRGPPADRTITRA